MLSVKKVEITPENSIVAKIEFNEPVNGHTTRLRQVLKEFYRRGLHNGAPRFCLEVAHRKVLLHVRADVKTPPTEQQVRAMLEYLEIGRVTHPPKEMKPTPPPFRRPRYA